jgi:hypothetical protein
VGERVAQISNAYTLLIGGTVSGGNRCPRSARKNLVRRIEQDAAALTRLMTAASALPDLLLARREAWGRRHEP